MSDALDVVARVAASILGFVLVGGAVRAAIRAFVLPRSARDSLSRVFFRAVRHVFEFRARSVDTYAQRDAIMALYAPVALLSLVLFFLVLLFLGFAALFFGLIGVPVGVALTLSGSSLLTLGIAHPTGVGATALAFVAAAFGLTLVALVVAYLPAMYAAFARREMAVTRLTIRAGAPPSGVELLVRAHRLGQLASSESFWERWEEWFVDVEESHTSFAALIFFRSPQADRGWVPAGGAVLDAIALWESALSLATPAEVARCYQAGAFAFRRIAGFFRLVPDEPRPGDAVSVRRDEYAAAVALLAQAGVQLAPDANGDAGWQRFTAARVQYDEALIQLAVLTMAPYAPWSSDRSLRRRAHVLDDRVPLTLDEQEDVTPDDIPAPGETGIADVASVDLTSVDVASVDVTSVDAASADAAGEGSGQREQLS